LPGVASGLWQVASEKIFAPRDEVLT